MQSVIELTPNIAQKLSIIHYPTQRNSDPVDVTNFLYYY